MTVLYICVPFSVLHIGLSLPSCVWAKSVRVWLFVTLWTVAWQAPLSMGLSKQKYWSGFPWLLQGIFPTQGLNLHLLRFLHCKRILYGWVQTAGPLCCKLVYSLTPSPVSSKQCSQGYWDTASWAQSPWHYYQIKQSIYGASLVAQW